MGRVPVAARPGAREHVSVGSAAVGSRRPSGVHAQGRARGRRPSQCTPRAADTRCIALEDLCEMSTEDLCAFEDLSDVRTSSSAARFLLGAHLNPASVGGELPS